MDGTAPKRPQARLPRTLTAEQLADAERLYLSGADVLDIAAELGVARRAVMDARDLRGWAQTRQRVLTAHADAAVAVAKSEAEQQIEVNRRQGEVSRHILDLLDDQARIIHDANEADPDKARATARSFGGIRGVAEVGRLAANLHTAKVEGDGEIKSVLSKLVEQIREESDDADDPPASPTS